MVSVYSLLRSIALFCLSLLAILYMSSWPSSIATSATPPPAPASTPPSITPSPPLTTPAAPVVPPLQPVERPLREVDPSLGLDQQLWGTGNDRRALLQAIDYSLDYLATDEAIKAYEQYAIPEFTRGRVRRSLQRFRQLVNTSESAAALQAAVQQEFTVYQSIGTDGHGTVDFTGYFQPTYRASRVPTAEFRYPLYRLPSDLATWSKPHPTRRELEGDDGLQGGQGRLRGLELVWLRDRLEAFLVQVQGSAQLQLTDGSTMSVGYDGHTDYPYTSIGRQLADAGKFRLEDLSLPVVIQYFRDHPQDMDLYLPRNDRFVFFIETPGSPAMGSLNVPVTPERSIATDKSLMPPGALALIQTHLPQSAPQSDRSSHPQSTLQSTLQSTQPGSLRSQPVSRYVLDQDTGGAIRGPGRVDLYMGTGPQAGDRAGLINDPGQLYYLLLKD